MQDVSRLPSDRRPARIASLAVLPVFLSLKGKRAVVAGGSAAAAWKAELLAATGARVDLYAPMHELCDLFQDLIGQADPQISHHGHKWTTGIINGAAIAICDAQDESEARAFFDAARAAGVPVNVIDRPEFCQFQFGTIVNRSPVVVGVSTAGGAPILGQAIRRRIETLLPASLAAWASLAETIRGKVMTRLEAGAQRRKFWERFSDLAFGTAPTVNDEHELTRNIDRVSADRGSAVGRVTFVGAGPGDAELLTLKAVRALQAADVILFDDLVSDEVLELARREAERMMVGNPGGHKSRRHGDINDLMVKLAEAGKRVVRLESGDPMSLCRANGEIERLKAEGIPVDVVPGITFRDTSNPRLVASVRARPPCAILGASQIANGPSDATDRPLCGIDQTMPPPPEATAGRSPATFLR